MEDRTLNSERTDEQKSDSTSIQIEDISRESEEFYSEDNTNVNEDFAKDTGTPKNVVKRFNWEYGAYEAFRYARNFFFGEPKPTKSQNKFSDLAETLISSIPDNSNNPELLNSSGKLLEQQRMLEDTRARRRLEKWATRVIVWYLLAVFILVIVNGLVLIFHPVHTNEIINLGTANAPKGFISDSIMTIILSTTTINIIGLGLIVLRGHFPQENKGKEKQ